MKVNLFTIFLIILISKTYGEENCPARDFRQKISVGKSVCCNSLIRTVVETGMNKMELFGESRPNKALNVIVKLLQNFVQRHFGTSFEIVMSQKDFQLNTHYNGSKMCKFESNKHILAVYETPVKYDITSAREAFFSNFGLNDSPKLLSHTHFPILHRVGLLRNHGLLNGGLLG